MEVSKAIEILERQKNIIPSLENKIANVAFNKWHRDTRVAIANVFLEKPEYSLEFSQIYFSITAYSGRTTEADRINKFNKGLHVAYVLLDSMIGEIKDYGLPSKACSSKTTGDHIFIGHGRSPIWRELKDYIKDKLNLPYDEFNRVPVAGVSNTHRLQQMLDQAAFAFLIMTAEDESSSGSKQARMNVVHEVGLFQGKLGFEKAIILLEDGCEEFSNINGLGQVRFPAGNVSAIFHQIQDVLEREGLLE
ncbi:TIR domain-containing protein [Serratia fonticola]|uniref:TIR domain-containing protein n=1 Tax=Serratia fonticola TaxID=47917 RepID=UPI0024DF0291|nr:TIR domain-containing protein [Serratia fonticola]MDK2375055.1 nucleotide-binding protein [Serratia fonticola]